jgi:NAD(P)-dependent dehydrogenase (short-subunit alcohol dehydrogenase family)
MQLTETAAIITGGGSGLGAATARLLALYGVRVAVLDKNREAAQEVADSIGGIACTCDVTDESSTRAAIAKSEAAHGIARIVVNCAGILGAGRLLGREGPMPLTHFQQTLAINLTGAFNVMRLAAQSMTALEPITDDGERGLIIHTASIAAYEGQIGQVAYAASKAGVVGMVLPSARELSRFGIRVNAIAPGPVDTPMVAGMTPEVRESLEASIPFPSRLIKPEEYAQLVKHLIENSAINGEVIRLDAAMRMASK